MPLAATWLMMAAEGPYVAAIIARLPRAEFNLAAYGVAFSFAFIAEAPIMMMLTAANTLVRDRQSFLALRRFAYGLNFAVTAALAVAVIPPLFRFVTDRLIGLPPEIARLAHLATATLVLWPGAIGYRRFYQGILVRHHLTRRVAYGTIVRLVSMSATAGLLAAFAPLPGACIGALALVTGVLMEAAASRWMARQVVAQILADRTPARDAELTLPEIAQFYYPLALTSVLSLVIGPLVTFFLGRSRSPIESLAVLPVVNGFVFLFRSGGIAYQEVGVALMGRGAEDARVVRRAMLYLAALSTLGLTVMLLPPVADLWFRTVSGLSRELSAFAIGPTRLLVLFPALEYVLSFQRSGLILARRTRTITLATAIEAGALVLALFVGVAGLDMVGALAAAGAMLLGRLAANTFLALAPGESSGLVDRK
jgi:progressive ankylosis protein